MASQARKLLERMRRSVTGWNRTDLDRLYRGFGFEIRHGKNHDIVVHPKYRLRTVVPRHSPVKPVYIRTAVEMIDELEQLRREEEAGNEC